MAPPTNYVVSYNFCAIGADTVDDLAKRLEEFVNHPAIADLISDFKNTVSSSPAANVAYATAALGATEVKAGPEVVQGKYYASSGEQYTFNHPDAPDANDGRGKMVLKEWRSQKGNDLKKWVDPIKSPRPIPVGASGESEEKWV